MKNALILLLSIFFLFSIKGNSLAEKPKNVQRVAYLKNNKNRIMIYVFEGLVSSKEMQEHIATNEPYYTNGRFTAAYYFPKGSRMPSPGFSSLRSIDQANSVLYDSGKYDPWEFAYMRSFNGKTTFVNCMETQNHDLCMK